MKIFFGILLIIPLLFWGGIRTYKDVIFDIDCAGHLKRAADANTVELAKQEMTTVISYLEKNNITNGYTSILYRTPDEDIGFWYQNLKSSLNELEKTTSQTTQLEKSNILMKLRETILDSTEHGQIITGPDGISVFPNNTGYAFFGTFGLILFSIGVMLIIKSINDY